MDSPNIDFRLDKISHHLWIKFFWRKIWYHLRKFIVRFIIIFSIVLIQLKYYARHVFNRNIFSLKIVTNATATRNYFSFSQTRIFHLRNISETFIGSIYIFILLMKYFQKRKDKDNIIVYHHFFSIISVKKKKSLFHWLRWEHQPTRNEINNSGKKMKAECF